MNDNLLHLPVHAIEPDPRETQLLTPELLSYSGNDSLGIWQYSDGTVVLRVGPSTELAAPTIALDPEQIGPMWRMLEALGPEQIGRVARALRQIEEGSDV